MRILYFAKDAPSCNSGYGKCVREISTRLKAKGHEFAIFASVGNQGTSLLNSYQGIPIYPATDNIFGEDVCVEHYNHFRAEIYLTQIDIWPLQKLHLIANNLLLNWVAYAPIDFYPIPEEIIGKLRSASYVVCMSQWAEGELRKLGFTELETIHHGVDTQIYKPLPLEECQNLKTKIGFSKDTYLIGLVMANQPFRKAWEEQLRAIKIFSERNPQVKLGVYIHTLPNIMDSWDISRLVRAVGLKAITLLSNPYQMILGYSEEEMAEIYNAFDLLLNASGGEGFGLPIIEAEATGTPVIATDFSSMPELVKGGQLAKVNAFFLVPNLAFGKARPDIKDLADKIEMMYYKTDEFLREDLACWTKENFDWDRVIIPKWLNLFDRLSLKLSRTCSVFPKGEFSDELKAKSKEEILIE